MSQPVFQYTDFFHQTLAGAPINELPEIGFMISNFRRFVRKLIETGNVNYYVAEIAWDPVTNSTVYQIKDCSTPPRTVQMTDKAIYHLFCIEQICTNFWSNWEDFKKN